MIAQFAYDAVYADHSKQPKYQQHKEIAGFLRAILQMQGKASHTHQFGLKWNPRSFNNLCERALKRKDATLMAFCQDVANEEWRLLLQHSYSFI